MATSFGEAMSIKAVGEELYCRELLRRGEAPYVINLELALRQGASIRSSWWLKGKPRNLELLDAARENAKRLGAIIPEDIWEAEYARTREG